MLFPGRVSLLPWRGRGSGQASQINIAGLLSAGSSDLTCAGVAATPDLGMAIGKSKVVAEIMTMRGQGREIKPHPAGRVCNEESVVYAALVFIDDHPEL